MDAQRRNARKKSIDEDPYDRHEEKVTKKAFKSVEKSVKPVAKDTNKTRRTETRARIVGDTVSNVEPRANLKAVLKKITNKYC